MLCASTLAPIGNGYGGDEMNSSAREFADARLGAALARADGRIMALYEYWQAKKGDRSVPLQREIDPTELAKFLSSIILVDVKAAPDGDSDFVYRLVGTREVAERGYDPTGRRVAEFFRGPSAEDALRCYRAVVETGAPHVDLTPFETQEGNSRDVGNIFLPFSEDGHRVTRILVYTAFQSRPGF
jgi:hypothetical protein